MKSRKLYAVVLLLVSVLILAYKCFSMSGMGGMSEPGTISGEKIFKTNCLGCHLNGQNLIKSEKPVIGSIKLRTKQDFKAWLENPLAPMPSFKNITSKDKQLEALYNYVISLMGK